MRLLRIVAVHEHDSSSTIDEGLWREKHAVDANSFNRWANRTPDRVRDQERGKSGVNVSCIVLCDEVHLCWTIPALARSSIRVETTTSAE